MLIVFSGFGVATSLVSKGVMGVMVGMELAFFGVIPLMLVSSVKEFGSAHESEGALVYFVFQSLGSMVMFLSLVMLISSSHWYVLSWSMFIMSMSMKLGIFPFHSWVVTVAGLSSWTGVLFVLVVMKLAPYWMLSGMGLPAAASVTLVLLSCITTALGAVSACNQSTLRGVLGCSSLSQSGFMMGLSLVSAYYYVGYFVVYSSIMSSMVISCSLKNSPMLVMASLMSLSGMPPLLGMFMKFGGLYCLSGVSPSLCVFLAACSLFGFFYYFNAMVEVYYSSPLVGGAGWTLILVNVLVGPVLFMSLFPLM
uniref:NADH dehydrogenase subunit 2 n=1 Tax=Hippopus porcellanus TaxID=80819 RepID=UPI00226CC0AD|nr:NADH dehydrogenase subunit 2 [Hippopus porcellanus]UZM09094.1 NADH dehydrogenase subunit 2 [Hippopus porcellanus]